MPGCISKSRSSRPSANRAVLFEAVLRGSLTILMPCLNYSNAYCDYVALEVDSDCYAEYICLSRSDYDFFSLSRP
jgi:hypothetical protein